ncbi:MAG: sugar ABC transporter ATP-binding protein [Christensenellaceae bacterium]|nr:sugar ABC transporter ATP-binding protein [Christensenellaceae bacterium]
MNKMLLKMENINKSFGSNKVLQGINLTLENGEVLALLGENGAGKSTLIKILGGIYKADSGSIYIHGEKKDITAVAIAAENGIRIIHQEIVLLPNRTVAANIFLGREFKNKFGFIDYNRMYKEADKLLKEYNLSMDPDTMVGDLSIGQKQFVEIIKAVSASAKIVVMDEPTASLSQGETEELFKIIRQLKNNGIGIIYISHKLEELFEIADRIIVLRDGYIVGNEQTSSTNKDRLISLMVGRSLSKYYTHTQHITGDIALEVKNLSHEKYFKNVSFHAKYGEIVGFSGLVGAGRTELMKTIFGVYKKSAGIIKINNIEKDIKNPIDAINSGLVYVSEDRRAEGLIMTNNVRFNMGLACLRELIKGININHSLWDQIIQRYVEMFQIRITSENQIVSSLSGGNQQKLVLSKWLATKPRVLILDEPTRGIDVGSKAEIYKIIDKLASEGTCIIMVSSELPEVLNMCDRCYIMCDGEITGHLNAEEFSQEDIMKYATKTSTFVRSDINESK